MAVYSGHSSKARVVVGDVYGQLKGGGGACSKGMTHLYITKASYVLHNV